MGFLDMFDKLDDIIYKPVQAICDWVEEPLKKWEHGREMDSYAQDAQAKEDMYRLEAQIEMERKQQETELLAQSKKWDAEIEEMIAEQEDARRDKLVEALKNYQIQLATASRDIVNSIGEMSLELRSKANDLVLEKTQAYRRIQQEAKAQSMQEMKEAKDDFFESDPETYHILINDIMQERRTMVDTAAKCIVELSEDLARLNANTDILMRQGMAAIEGYLKPMMNGIGRAMNTNSCSIPIHEKQEAIDVQTVEVNYIEEK